jgi:hypothetical protein
MLAGYLFSVAVLLILFMIKSDMGLCVSSDVSFICCWWFMGGGGGYIFENVVMC